MLPRQRQTLQQRRNRNVRIKNRWKFKGPGSTTGWLLAAPTPSAGGPVGRGYKAWSVSAPCLVRGFKYPLWVQATCSTIARHISV